MRLATALTLLAFTPGASAADTKDPGLFLRASLGAGYGEGSAADDWDVQAMGPVASGAPRSAASSRAALPVAFY